MYLLLHIGVLCLQVMFLQNKGHVTMTVELLDTEEAQADDPLDVQVNKHIVVLSTILNCTVGVLCCHIKVCVVSSPQCLSSYMEQFVGTESSLCSQAEGYFFKPVFLPRQETSLINKFPDRRIIK